MPPSPHASSYVNYLGEARGASAISDRLGTLTGLLLGLLWVGREHRFAVDGPSREKIARFLLGAVGVLLIWRGLAWVLFKITPQDADTLVNIGRFGRYFLLTWWVSAGAPQLFIKLQMLRREDPALGVA
jgi:hypothetical protein